MFTEYHSTYNGLAKSQVKAQWHLILAKTQLSLNLEKPSFSYLALKHNHFKWCLPSLHGFGYAGAHSLTHTHTLTNNQTMLCWISGDMCSVSEFLFRIHFTVLFFVSLVICQENFCTRKVFYCAICVVIVVCFVWCLFAFRTDRF